MADKNYCSLDGPASMCGYLNEKGNVKDKEKERCTYFPPALEKCPHFYNGGVCTCFTAQLECRKNLS